jgi:DNA-binding CsgD family transcriptional regulator
MFLRSEEHRVLKECFRLLAAEHDETEIRALLGERLLELFRAEHFASYVWDPVGRAFGARVAINMNPSNLGHYETYYQFRDPITLKLQSRRHATLVSEVMPRDDFLRCEFFNDFLAKDGLHWGINLHAFDGDEALGDLRIWRGRTGEEFGARDKMLLDLLEPAFAAALCRARTHRAPRADPGGPGLSGREHEVALRVSRGMTNKEIARELHISVPTVNTYMRRIFDKTGVKRRSALAFSVAA